MYYELKQKQMLILFSYNYISIVLAIVIQIPKMSCEREPTILD